MPRRYTKGIFLEGGIIKTSGSVRIPALLPSAKNTDCYLMRVGVFRPRNILVKKSKVVVYPKGELIKPDIVVAIADIINEEQTESVDQWTEYAKELEILNTKLMNETNKLYDELRKVRTTSAENIAAQVDVVLGKFVDMQKALRPAAKKGGKF